MAAARPARPLFLHRYTLTGDEYQQSPTCARNHTCEAPQLIELNPSTAEPLLLARQQLGCCMGLSRSQPVAQVSRQGSAISVQAGSFAKHAGLDHSPLGCDSWRPVAEAAVASLCPGDRLRFGKRHQSKLTIAGVYYRVQLNSPLEAVDPFLAEHLQLWCQDARIGSVEIAATDSLVDVRVKVLSLFDSDQLLKCTRHFSFHAAGVRVATAQEALHSGCSLNRLGKRVELVRREAVPAPPAHEGALAAAGLADEQEPVVKCDWQLSIGILQRLHQDPDDVPSGGFVLQVLKKVHLGGGRIRLVVSDSEHYQQALVAPQCAAGLTEGLPDVHGLVQLTEVFSSLVQNRRILVIRKMQVLGDALAAGQIGEPKSIEQVGSDHGNREADTMSKSTTRNIDYDTPAAVSSKRPRLDAMTSTSFNIGKKGRFDDDKSNEH